MMKILTCAAGLLIAASAATASETFDVTLSGMDFRYNGASNMDIDLVINAGDTVRWTWVSGIHNVSSGFPDDPNPGSLFRSGSPTGTAGTTFEHTFDDAGVFGYHCEVHGSLGMFSQVSVRCNPVDFAQPYGTFDFFDAAAFLEAFSNQDPAADLATPLGTFDFFDVSAFLQMFSDGCP